jgi:rod shape determining protein RodA
MTLGRIRSILLKKMTVSMLVAILAVFGISVLVLFSASQGSWEKLSTHLVNILVAIVLMWCIANLPFQYLHRIALPLYFVGLLLLVLTMFIGDASKGAQRWLDLGFIRLQPSELMKIAVPLTLAWYFDRYEKVLSLSNFILAIVLLVIPVALILEQPDLGTAILVLASGFFIIFFAGLPLRVLLAFVVLFLLALPFAWEFLHEYQRLRVLTLLNPYADPLGSGYHTIQSAIALGSGGFFGKGWMNGTQSQLNFLPEGSTDFIFAVFGEEFGLLGILVLGVLYGFIVYKGLFIASLASTLFARLVAISVTLTFFIYAFVNIGMVTGILPVVGVPLPLVSYGGTSAVTLLLGLGILMNIDKNRRLVQT